MFLFIPVFIMVGLALLFALARLLLGPSLPDRVVALDLLTLLTVGLVASHAIATGFALFLDTALVLALIAFLGTVAFAYYVAYAAGMRAAAAAAAGAPRGRDGSEGPGGEAASQHSRTHGSAS